MSYLIANLHIAALLCSCVAHENDILQISFLQGFYRSTNGTFWEQNIGWDYVMSLNASNTNVTIYEIVHFDHQYLELIALDLLTTVLQLLIT